MNKDTFFASLTDEELKYLADTIGPMAAGALLIASDTADDSSEVFLHERALRKLTEALTAEMDERRPPMFMELR